MARQEMAKNGEVTKNHGKAAGAVGMLLFLLLSSWTDVHACIRHQKKKLFPNKKKI